MAAKQFDNRRPLMKVRTICCGFALLAAGLAADSACGWQPAEGPLKTRWTREVSPEKVWPEYPRPQMVRERDASPKPKSPKEPAWTNLNGIWQYAIRSDAEGRPKKWDGEILVPFAVESALSGVKKALRPDERLWYQRMFTVGSLPEGGDRHILLHFGAVDWKCTVWVDGKEVGQHTGGYDPFTFDITPIIRLKGEEVSSGEHELVVAVSDPTDTGSQPHGKQTLKPHGIWYTAVTGIWQTVWLESVPGRHIESFKVVPDIDRKIATVTVQATGKGLIDVRAIDPRRTDTHLIVAEKDGKSGEPLELALPDPALWSPEHPALYGLEIWLLDGNRIVDGGEIVDSVRGYFGMRKIEVKKDAAGINRLWLNNKVLFQYGPLDQGWWPDGLYTAPTDDALKYDIEMTKKFGMNMVRKHVKVEPDRWYYWCDKLGLIVWQDMPSGDKYIGPQAPDIKRSAESATGYEREWSAIIQARINHPSIIMWVPFNEGWGQFDTARIVNFTRKLDPTRLVDCASGWADRGVGDVSDMHSYPGPGMREPEKDRVCVLGEFGGLGMPVRGHTWQQEKNWGYVSYDSSEKLTGAYVDLLTAMRPLIGRGLSAAVYTQTSDVEGEVNGVMTYDREIVKVDAARIKVAANKLYLSPPEIVELVPTSEKVAQTWRYTTTKPEAIWFVKRFAADRWKNGLAGFGTEGTPGAIVRTKWDSSDIWLRRTFELELRPNDGQLALRIHHDEDAEVYLNDVLVASFKRHKNNYQLVLLSPDVRRLLKVGKNLLAVHCHQTTGGQYIDVGLVEIVEQ
jgi:hypothetical protein